MAPVTTDLRVLADRANAEHHAFEAIQSAAVGHAIACGTALLQAKSQVPHGSWLPWIDEHLAFTPRTARRYMTIARNGTRVSDSDSIRSALARLAKPTVGERVQALYKNRPRTPQTSVPGCDLGAYEPVGRRETARRLLQWMGLNPDPEHVPAALRTLAALIEEDGEHACAESTSSVDRVSSGEVA
jgi:hypothetical protein